jgi:hypothetical protein
MIEMCARTVAGALLAAIALPVPVFIGAGAFAQEIKLTRSAASGVQSLLVDERSWDAKCKPLATTVTITSKPSHGTVTVVPGMSIVAVSAAPSGSTAHCAGKSVTGTRIIYQSNSGFRGTDTLAYKVRYSNGNSGATIITINVQ